MKQNLSSGLVKGLILTLICAVLTIQAIPLQELQDNAIFPPEDIQGNALSPPKPLLKTVNVGPPVDETPNSNQVPQVGAVPSSAVKDAAQGPTGGNSGGSVEILQIAYDPSNSTNEEENYLESGPNMFTVTNTDVGFDWEKLPYREKYQWTSDNAPCHYFNLQIPDEKTGQSGITLCIFRPHLEFEDDTELFIHHVEAPETVQEQKELKVYGYVKGENGSAVYGKIANTYFYGEVSIYDQEEKRDVIYVVEEIKLLTKLMRYNEKILRNILYVMNDGAAASPAKEGSKKYNAVVTKGASLMNFMTSVNPSEFIRGSFIVFSTRHNSYITAGEPRMEITESGKVTLNAGGDEIIIDTEGQGSVHLKFRNNRDYIFRPNGKTVVHEGSQVTVLREHEGPIAVSAFTADSSYGCILPTQAFQVNRRGGYVCKVCLAADKLFLKHYVKQRGSHETAVSVLGRMIDRVDWMFRSVDWNNDNHPDNVGLDYDPQFDTWKYIDTGEENLSEEDLNELFGSLSDVDFTDCCIGLAYTMKSFPENVYAKSSLAGPGGACAVRTDGFYNNLILISANNKEGNFSGMTEDQLTYVTANQIAKAFGARSDGEGQDICDQFIDDKKETRHFLMWPDVLRNISAQEKVPSSCSKESVTQMLSTCKSACFDIDKHSFCGNGIVEEGEDCDCGSEYNCTQQKCCYSRTGLRPCTKTGIACKVPSSAERLSITIFYIYAIIFLAAGVDFLRF